MPKKTAIRPPTARVSSKSSWSFSKISGLSQGSTALIAVLVAALVWWNLNNGLNFLEPSDSEKLKTVFFGREPWLVLCHNGSDSVHSVFEGTARKMRKKVSFGVLDCNAQLPSKRTTLDRLKLASHSSPVLFFSGFGRRPHQLPSKVLSSEYSLLKELRAQTRLHAIRAKDTKLLNETCFSRTNCALFLAGGDLDASALSALNAASDALDWMNWVVVDSAKHKLSNEKDLGLPKFQPGVHRLVVLQKLNATAPDQTPPKSISTPYTGPWIEAPIVAHYASHFASFDEQDVEGVTLFDSSKTTLGRRPPPPTPKQMRQPPTSTPAAAPTEPTQVPTTQQAEMRERAEELRRQREARRRAQMDAEADDFIEFSEGEEADAENDGTFFEDMDADSSDGEFFEEEAQGSFEDSEEEEVLELD